MNPTKLLATCLVALSLITPLKVNATIVEFQTSHGNFQVNLFDTTTPKTVENFLSYVNDLHYVDSIIHRVAPGFVVQGGGFNFTGNWPLTDIPANAAIMNEPVYSNVKGTIAMAKLGTSKDSATDQWFFNLANNSSNLDLQNGGFTVFGQVTGDGMTVLEAIAKLGLCNNGNLQGIPMINYTAENCTNKDVPGIENFVVVEQITVIDSSSVTDANLSPAKNTLITKEPENNDSSGGTIAWLILCLLPVFSKKLVK